ncbi:hypothetical protein CANARDRAFT_173946 [[Candida] arabinofermentans NRRL YB-2248]|uniref:HTH CENPB-type domain-containing protein n=1 Tax=[Candida] arabinofermentans NRRL YB-2248 TaxID=983967 RepID=A0A1E4T8J9_9ASCO|nr:hypothetical protein CANARDRAFT_173946 [[Candida] arabinofermentans NRRL YB-2248]
MDFPPVQSRTISRSKRSRSKTVNENNEQHPQYLNQNLQLNYAAHQLLPKYQDQLANGQQQQHQNQQSQLNHTHQQQQYQQHHDHGHISQTPSQHQQQPQPSQDQVQQVQQQLARSNNVHYNPNQQYGNIGYSISAGNGHQLNDQINGSTGTAIAVAAVAATSNSGATNTNSSPSLKRLPRATLEQKIQVLDWHNRTEKKCQQKTVVHFKEVGQFAITKSTLNRWVMEEKQLRESYQNLTLNNTKLYKTKPKYKQPEVHRCLEILYEQSCCENQPITERELIEKWTKLYKDYHNAIDADIPAKSNGWLHHFKKTNAVKRDSAKRYHNSTQRQGPVTVEMDQERIKMVVSAFKPSHVYQIDEISFNTKPTFMINNSDPETRTNGLSIDDPANKVTVALLANADGSRFFDPLIVSDEPSLKNIQEPNMEYNKNGILTMEIFFKYITYVDSVLTAENSGPCVLLLDGLYSHIIPTDSLQTLRLEYFASDVVDKQYHYYPLDYGIKRLFKSMVKLNYLQSFNALLSSNNKKSSTGVKFVIGKNELIQYIMGAAAWMQNKNLQVNICYCFQKSGMVSNYTPQQNVFSDVELGHDRAKEEALLSILFEYQKHQLVNQNVDLNQLLFPDDEEVNNVHLSDSDVISLVKREFNTEGAQSRNLMKVQETPQLSQSIRMQQEYIHGQDYYQSIQYQTSTPPPPSHQQQHNQILQSNFQAHPQRMAQQTPSHSQDMQMNGIENYSQQVTQQDKAPSTGTGAEAMTTSAEDLQSLNSIKMFFSKPHNITKFPDLAEQFYKYFPNHRNGYAQNQDHETGEYSEQNHRVGESRTIQDIGKQNNLGESKTSDNGSVNGNGINNGNGNGINNGFSNGNGNINGNINGNGNGSGNGNGNGHAHGMIDGIGRKRQKTGNSVTREQQ